MASRYTSGEQKAPQKGPVITANLSTLHDVFSISDTILKERRPAQWNFPQTVEQP